MSLCGPLQPVKDWSAWPPTLEFVLSSLNTELASSSVLYLFFFAWFSLWSESLREKQTLRNFGRHSSFHFLTVGILPVA